MKKFALIILSFTLYASWCFAAEQVPVAVVFSADLEPYRTAWEGFRKHVQEQGAAMRVSEFTMGKESSALISGKIAQKKPALVAAIGPEASKFAKERIKDIPVVYCMVLRTDDFGERNMTGVSLEIPFRTKFDTLRKILPIAKKIGMIYSSRSMRSYREMLEVCREKGCQVVGKEIESATEFPNALKELSWQIDAFFMVPDAKIYFAKSIEHLLVEGLRNKVPVIGLSASYTRAGALISLDVDYGDLGRQAGAMALRILAGEAPSHIRPENPEAVRFSVNAATAERLGLTLSETALREASEVFGK